MGLQTHDSVDHLGPNRFQPVSPIDVGFLIESRLELDHRQHFLAPARGLQQQLHQFRLPACSVDGLLDGQHIRVGHRLPQQLQHRLKAFVGMVQQQITLAHLRHQGLAARSKVARPSRLESRKAQIRAIDLIDELVQPHEIDGTVHLEHGGIGNAELTLQDVDQRLGAGADHLQADGLPVVAPGELKTQGLA